MPKAFFSAVTVGVLFFTILGQAAPQKNSLIKNVSKNVLGSSNGSFEDGFDLLNIEVISGTTLNIRSGATLNINSGATFTNNAATAIVNTLVVTKTDDNAFVVEDDSNVNALRVDTNGATQVVVTSITDSATAFVVEDTSNNDLFTVDTSGNQVIIGDGSGTSVYTMGISTFNMDPSTTSSTAFVIEDASEVAAFGVNTATNSVTIDKDLTLMGTGGMSIIDTGLTSLQIFAPGGGAHAKTLKIRGDLSISGDLFNAAIFELQSGFKNVSASLDTKEKLISQIQANVYNVSKEVVTLKEVVHQTSSPLGFSDADFPKNVNRKEVKQLVSGSQSSADLLHTHTNFPLNVTFDKDTFSKGQQVTLNALKKSKYPLVSFSTESFKPLLSMAGMAQLNGGEITIYLPSDYIELVAVDRAHPLLVQLTPEGECNGLYISQRLDTKFTVKELHQGRSNVLFSWRVEATKKGFEELEPSATLEEYQQMKLSR